MVQEVGCKQHGLSAGATDYYCYVAGVCEGTASSQLYPGANWRPCNATLEDGGASRVAMRPEPSTVTISVVVPPANQTPAPVDLAAPPPALAAPPQPASAAPAQPAPPADEGATVLKEQQLRSSAAFRSSSTATDADSSRQQQAPEPQHAVAAAAGRNE